METSDVQLIQFGYDEFFESNRKKLLLDKFSVARVVAEHKGFYDLINQNGEFLAKVTGKSMFKSSSREDYPAVGDWVAISKLDSKQAIIQAILPRKTIIQRKRGDKNKDGDKTEIQIIGTNIDVVFVVESVDRDYNLNRIERYLAIVHDGGAKPAIILNKIDLISKAELDSKILQIENRFPDVDIILSSMINDEGIGNLKAFLESRKTYCFLGSSGVGKSSLINKLLAESIIKTRNISSYSGRGKHTTTSRELYFLTNGSIVMDNPGMREVGMANVESGLESVFDEITDLAKNCKYDDCEHTHEPECEVLEALRSGRLDEEKYNNYVNLKKEVEFYEMSKQEKREKNCRFGKFIKKAMRDLGKFKY